MMPHDTRHPINASANHVMNGCMYIVCIVGEISDPQCGHTAFVFSNMGQQHTRTAWNLVPLFTGMHWTQTDDTEKYDSGWRLPLNSEVYPSKAYFFEHLSRQGWISSYGSDGINSLLCSGHYESLFNFTHLSIPVIAPLVSK